MPGVTVLIHDQACAAENRRGRKRGQVAEPGFRVVINERVCEGCGDCGDKSNCLSVQPVDTRRSGARRASTRRAATSTSRASPATARRSPPSTRRTATARNRVIERDSGRARRSGAPVSPSRARWCHGDEFIVRISGIGGTGVVTVSQILGTAAMLDGLLVRGLDQTGLSQKAGPVVSDSACQPRRGAGVEQGDVGRASTCLLAFDLLVAASRRPPRRRLARSARWWSGQLRRPRPARWSSTPRSPYPERRRPHRPPRRRCRAPTLNRLRRHRRDRRPGCSATPRPPTSSCSASPCRPAPCRWRRRRSSGRSSSTAWPSNATSRPSAGDGGGSCDPQRGASRRPASTTPVHRDRATT